MTTRTTEQTATFRHAGLSRAQLDQARRQAAALAVHSRGPLATSWRRLAVELQALTEPAGGGDG